MTDKIGQTTNVKIVFFGNERLATGVTTSVPTLRGLLAAGYDVAAVVSHNSASTSRNQRQLEIADIAAQHNIPLLLPDKPAEIIDQLRAFKAEVGVLVAYGKIVPQSVIDLFPHGIINIHPSLLPRHRGPTPIESVILDGSAETGVSVMRLVKAMDAGPVYSQKRLNIDSHETKQQLADRLSEAGATLLLETLPTIIADRLLPVIQNDNQASYDALLTKSDGRLDFNKPARLLEREIRAFQGWPKSHTTLASMPVIITAAHAIPVELIDSIPGDIQVVLEAHSIVIRTGNGSLSIERLKPAGKSEMSVQAFLVGYSRSLQH